MKKLIYSFLLISFPFIIACNDSATKAGTEEPKLTTPDRQASVPATDQTNVAKPDTMKATPADNGILANIDKHLVSIIKFNELKPGTEGIRNGLLTVQNKLSNAVIQKAIVEIKILLADNKEYRTEYITMVNIEPGTEKIARLPDADRGVKVTAHVVKIKSPELTNGETLATGIYFSSNK